MLSEKNKETLGSAAEKTYNSMEDIFNDEFFKEMMAKDGFDKVAADIFIPEGDERRQRRSYHKGEGEITSTSQPCKDFHKYQAALNKAQSIIDAGSFEKTATTENAIKVGDAFVFAGVLGVVVGINASENRKSGQTSRAHIVYVNGKENHLLLSSVVANCYKPRSYYVQA